MSETLGVHARAPGGPQGPWGHLRRLWRLWRWIGPFFCRLEQCFCNFVCFRSVLLNFARGSWVRHCKGPFGCWHSVSVCGGLRRSWTVGAGRIGASAPCKPPGGTLRPGRVVRVSCGPVWASVWEPVAPNGIGIAQLLSSRLSAASCFLMHARDSI